MPRSGVEAPHGSGRHLALGRGSGSQCTTATTVAEFLETLEQRRPFPIRALQVHRGGQFADEFEQACQQRRLRLFVLPPRSPKLNGAVKRA